MSKPGFNQADLSGGFRRVGVGVLPYSGKF